MIEWLLFVISMWLFIISVQLGKIAMRLTGMAEQNAADFAKEKTQMAKFRQEQTEIEDRIRRGPARTGGRVL